MPNKKGKAKSNEYYMLELPWARRKVITHQALFSMETRLDE
jgi:hypothetical protein